MDEAVKFFEQSEIFFNKFKHRFGGVPYPMEDLFQPESEDIDQI